MPAFNYCVKKDECIGNSGYKCYNYTVRDRLFYDTKLFGRASMIMMSERAVKDRKTNYWADRILAQLEYASKLSLVNGEAYDTLIKNVSAFLQKRIAQDGTVTRESALEAEKLLGEISAEAKKYSVICAAHAHIDMNWMWRWDETVSITLDTFRTMLELMKEYPDFKFSQSQASVYKIVEEYDPEMLEEIKARVKEGRWEVTASTWVETDKNMPNGESLARHILYTKRYLSGLLGINPESLKIDFEPDTFGHSRNVPEILSEGGVRYYYHCRGYDGYHIYRWKAPSQASVIAYREPIWYNAEIDSSFALFVPEFCSKHGIDSMLKVYGVGDHGGGPTRRDINRLIDMSTWTVFPRIRFGTFSEYFSRLEDIKEKLPVVEKELNFVFDGCYTTQTRIKKGNKMGERMLNEAEAFCSMSSLNTGAAYPSDDFEQAWRNVLFNHFHDIIPGSGVIDTREYAMGLYQNTFAAATSRKMQAFSRISGNIDFSGLVSAQEDIRESTSEGAGVGFGIGNFKISQSSRGAGKTRVFCFFNSASHAREEVAEVVVWDWNGDIDRIVFKDEKGVKVKHQTMDQGFDSYWGHSYLKVLVMVKVPACGYSTYVMTEAEDSAINMRFPDDPRVQKADEFVLENSLMKVTFDSVSISVISLVDKTTGENLVDTGKPACIFRLIREDAGKGMTAWIVGRYMDIESLHRNVKIKDIKLESTNLRKLLTYELEFGTSKLTASVILDEDSPLLRFNVHCDWREVGVQDKYVPQLGFYLPLAYSCPSYKYDIPFGTIEREGMDIDVPANNWACGSRNGSGKAVMLVSGSKYGFRCNNDSMSITLIRSSYDPDPCPEFGIHDIDFAIAMVDNTKINRELIKLAYDYNHLFNVFSARLHKGGTLRPSGSFMSVEGGSIAVSCVKMSEENPRSNMLIRVYETDGCSTKAVLKFFKKLKKAYLVDLNEMEIEAESLHMAVSGDRAAFDVQPFCVASLVVEF
jgi:alpha-mannosidase